MKVVTRVPVDLYNKLMEGNEIKAITDFENGFSKQAYKLLSDVANKNNFFFGLELDTVSTVDLPTLLSGSNENNRKDIIMDIPKSELFEHDYYDFSSLIYDCEDYDGISTPLSTLKEYAKSLSNSVTEGRPVQVIYDRINPEWIIK